MSVSCHRCKSTRNVQLVVDGMWTCSLCVYKMEVRANPEDTLRPRTRALPVQEETLFPVEQYTRHGYAA